MKKYVLTLMYSCMLGGWVQAAVIRWTGLALDEQWMSAQNWEGGVLPGPTDDVWLDHSLVQQSYRVLLPTQQSVSIRSLTLAPETPFTISVQILPTSLLVPALSCSGLIRLQSGSLLHNQSGATSGLVLVALDSFRIEKGARYWHQTRTSHAAIVSKLSRVAETAQGIFEIDVPGTAGYTVSITGRTYGALYLSASSGPRSYTSTGSSPLHVRGDWVIGPGVNYSIDLQNQVRVGGHFHHRGNRLDLSAQDQPTLYTLEGDIRTEPQSIIRASSLGRPILELAGTLHQVMELKGLSEGPITWRCRHSTLTLLTPWRIGYALELESGIVHASVTAPVVIDAGASLKADSTHGSCYIEGPLTRMGAKDSASWLFPVGSGRWQRWIHLTNGKGRVTVQYMRFNPIVFGSQLDTPLVQLSALEYWKLVVDSVSIPNTKATLSYHPAYSGTILMPSAMRVAQLDGQLWKNRGQTAAIQTGMDGGYVISQSFPLPIGTHYLSLATTDLANVLPWTNPVRRPALRQSQPFSCSIRGQGGQLHISIQSPKAIDVPLVILDLQGRKCMQQTLHLHQGANLIQIPCTGFQRGIYLGVLQWQANEWKTIPFHHH